MPKPSPILDPSIPPSESDRKQDDLAVSGASVESTPPKKRRRFAASEKLRLLKAADAALATGELGALEALLRKEGIYSSHLSAWRQQPGARGTTGQPQKPGRKPKLDDKDRQLLAMTKELAVVKRKLLIANGLISLQKKAREIAPTSCEPSPTTLAHSPPAIDGVLKALTRVARPPPLLRDHTHPTQQPPPLQGGENGHEVTALVERVGQRSRGWLGGA